MIRRNYKVKNAALFLSLFFLAWACFSPMLGFAQEVNNVQMAFESLNTKPEEFLIANEMQVPMARGHLQGVQLMEKNGIEKLLLSGSSLSEAYVLQVDLESRKTDKLITLMKSPYRHAGGIQISTPYLAVGIEDNFVKTTSKVCLYNYQDGDLYNAKPNLVMEREGEAKRYTAGTTGILHMENGYLIAVSNWDSRDWDFYKVDLEKGDQEFLHRFTAPDDWGSYQSINLIMDAERIYAIGTYQKEQKGIADLILVSKQEEFKPIMELIQTKPFRCTNGVDFSTAAGIQVGREGKLHIWATQRDATKQIAINKFSQR